LSPQPNQSQATPLRGETFRFSISVEGGVTSTRAPQWGDVLQLGPTIERAAKRRDLQELLAAADTRDENTQDRPDTAEEAADRTQTTETMFLGQMHSLSVRLAE
jgi:hypothetical protein